jgi:uncharacterized protein HemX
MSDTSNNLSLVAAVVVALISSGGLQWFLGRRERKKQEERDRRDEEKREKKDEDDAEKREVDRRELLSKAQAAAQEAALASSDRRYNQLDEDYRRCREGLVDLSQATDLMINLFEKIIIRLEPTSRGENQKFTVELELAEVNEVRVAISAARRHLR